MSENRTETSETKDVSRREAVGVVAKYAAVTAPVMMSLIHGDKALAAASGGGKKRPRKKFRRKKYKKIKRWTRRW